MKCVLIEKVRSRKNLEVAEWTKRVVLKGVLDKVDLVLSSDEASDFEETKTYEVKITKK